MENARKFAFNVQERDIDLLLLGQCNISEVFVSWLADKVGIVGAKFDEAHHSVVTDRGETDVLLYVNEPEGRIAIMIEDKIGAVMQPRQCERYHERGEALVNSGAIAGYRTLLCAPNAYIVAVPPNETWHGRISFEEIADWLTKQDSPVNFWHARILNAASLKLGRARWADEKSNLAFNEQLALLKSDYRQFILLNYPNLQAKVQTGRDREYYIAGSGLPPGIRFKHSFFKGFVMMILERRWVEAGEVWLKSRVPEGGSLLKHGGELHLLLTTEIFDPELPFEAQQETAKVAIDRILTLKDLATQFVETTEPPLLEPLSKETNVDVGNVDG